MRFLRIAAVLLLLLFAFLPDMPIGLGNGTGWTLTGWNNLGMHCMDADYSVFSILPPYNTIHAQLVDADGQLVTNPSGITVSYQAVTDPQGSINTTAAGKTNFWDYVQVLYGASPAVDMGLAGKAMPGASNTPKSMDWEAANTWFVAEGIPITPYDDAHQKNPYPLMRLTARDSQGVHLATTDIVLPVSDEMDCRACHASGTVAAAMPDGGWANNPDDEIDYRLNILLLHDDRRDNRTAYQNGLVAAGYNPLGLYPTWAQDHKPVLCARCHPSNALPGSGLPGLPQLTLAVHGRHATVMDPLTGLALGNTNNRSACYRCHPGSATRCLRGAMGKAVAADGTMAMQCQSCHGSMSAVGAINRTGWLDEPGCQNCHTGTAMNNNGKIRYTSALLADGSRRQAVNTTFATNPDTPAPGFSLFRFSHGHGGLACEACHGSTHAEFPSFHDNDNIQSQQLQNHVGVLSDCETCHGQAPRTVTGGPHGMHPVGQVWVERHPSAAEDGGGGACRTCHGTDYKGTELSRALGDRTISAFGQKFFWRGFQVGCLACHRGPDSESRNSNRPAVAQDATLNVMAGLPSALTLSATDADKNALTYRIISQPGHGTVGLSGAQATYFPDAGFQGRDSFTFSAWDGQTDSNLGTVSVLVGADTCTLTCSATVPATGQEGAAVAFNSSATATGCLGTPVYSWVFGDGATASLQNASHTYAHSGTFNWSLNVSAGGKSCAQNGTIAVAGLPPAVTSVKPSSKGFELTVKGSNFNSTIEVFVGGTPWTNVKWTSAQKITLKGGNALKALFPAKTWVNIRLVNPDDHQEVTVQYNRTTKKWRGI